MNFKSTNRVRRSEQIRLLIVDDFEISRIGLKNILENNESIEVINEADDGLEAVEFALHYNPDVILMDYLMPKMDGLNASRIIKSKMPQTKIILYTSQEEDQDLLDAITLGINGIIFKSNFNKNLDKLIRLVYQDWFVFSKSLIKLHYNIIDRQAVIDNDEVLFLSISDYLNFNAKIKAEKNYAGTGLQSNYLLELIPKMHAMEELV